MIQTVEVFHTREADYQRCEENSGSQDVRSKRIAQPGGAPRTKNASFRFLAFRPL